MIEWRRVHTRESKAKLCGRYCSQEGRCSVGGQNVLQGNVQPCLTNQIWHVLIFCLQFYSCAVVRYPSKSNLKEESFILAHNLKVIHSQQRSQDRRSLNLLIGHTHNQEAETKGFMHSASLFLLRESYCPLLGISIST